jgi:hypothetical protein
VTKE